MVVLSLQPGYTAEYYAGFASAARRPGAFNIHRPSVRLPPIEGKSSICKHFSQLHGTAVLGKAGLFRLNQHLDIVAARGSSGDEWKEQLFDLFPEQAKKHTSTRRRRRDEEASENSHSMDEMTVEDVFSLESGWSVEALGSDDDLMQIGDEVRPCAGTMYTYRLLLMEGSAYEQKFALEQAAERAQTQPGKYVCSFQ